MHKAQRQLTLFALLVATLAVGLIGYLGYVLYPRFGLPPVTGASLLALAAAAGVAAFFSPCSFPLLFTLLVREGETDGNSTVGRSVRSALALAGGAALFLTGVGALVALGAGSAFEDVTFTSVTGRAIRAVVGVLLVGLGLIQLNLIPVSFHAVADLGEPLLGRQARLRRRRPTAAFFLFGFIYLIAGFG